MLPAAQIGVLRDGIFARSFSPAPPDARRIGAEVELLAFDVATAKPLPLLGTPRALIPLLRRYGARAGWTAVAGYGPIPKFETSGGAVVSFEPGGQVEVSTPACDTVGELVRSAHAVVLPLRTAMLDEGVALESVGIDPFNDAPEIAPQLPVDRYERMAEYLESIGPFGIRMMRQAAAIQVSLDRGDDPASRWRLLNDLAPYVTAIFANSPRHAGAETGHQSYRAHCWRMLDHTRTGVASPATDPAAAYVEFALNANDMFLRNAAGRYRPFRDWAGESGSATPWEAHLTTLFPEVRPRGHYEVRSCDAVDPSLYAVPVVLLAGLVYDDRAARDAAVLASDSRALLAAAGARGLDDGAIARTARDLFQLGLDGARRLGAPFIDGADIDAAQQYAADYTRRDRSPASDPPPSWWLTHLRAPAPTTDPVAALPASGVVGSGYGRQ